MNINTCLYSIFKKNGELKLLLFCIFTYALAYYNYPNIQLPAWYYNLFTQAYAVHYLCICFAVTFIILCLPSSWRTWCYIALAGALCALAPRIALLASESDSLVFASTITAAAYIILINLECLIWKHRIDYPLPIDKMNRERVYTNNKNRLRKLILERNALQMHTGKCACVCGLWGSGKTHFINYIKHHLFKKEKLGKDYFNGQFSIAHVDLWSCENTEDAWEKIIKSISHALSAESDSNDSLIHSLIKTCEKLANTGNAYVAAAVATIIYYRNKSHIENPVKVVKDCIDFPFSNKAILLILDDMERAKPEIIIDLFPLLNRLKEIPGILTLCAFSTDILTKKLAQKGYDNDYYNGLTAKLFDLQIELPPFSGNDSKQLLLNLLRSQQPDAEKAIQFVERNSIYPDTPRQIQVAADVLAKCEKFYLRNNYGASKEFLYLPILNDLTSSIIFTVELLKTFYSDVIPSFISNNSYGFIKNKLGDGAFVYLHEGNVKEFCHDDEYLEACPFLNEERCSSEFFCSLFADFFNDFEYHHIDNIVNATYATCSYITYDEGISIIKSSQKSDLMQLIQNTVPRFFNQIDLKPAACKILSYAASQDSPELSELGIEFVKNKLAPTIEALNFEEQASLFNELFPILLSRINISNKQSSISISVEKSINTLLDKTAPHSLYLYLKEYKNHASFSEAMLKKVHLKRTIFIWCKTEQINGIMNRLTHPFEKLANSIILTMQRNQSFEPEELYTDVMVFVHQYNQGSSILQQIFQGLHSQASATAKYTTFTSLVSQIAQDTTLLSYNLTLLQMLALKDQTINDDEQKEIGAKCLPALSEAAHILKKEPTNEKPRLELLSLIDHAITKLQHTA